MRELNRHILFDFVRKIGIATLLVFCFAAFSANTYSQTVIAFQGFESTPPANNWAFSNTGGAVSTNAGAADTPANQRIRTGAASFQVNNASATLNFANVTIPTGFSGVQVIVHLSSTSATTGNGADSTDTVSVSVALNGGAFPATPDITIIGGPTTSSNSRWSYNDTANDVTTAGTPITGTGTAGTNNGTIHSTLVINIPNGTTSVALQINAINNSTGEFWNIDDVTLQGFGPTAAPASISGQVTMAGGRGIQKVRVMISGGDLEEPLYALTNVFGYYKFENLTVGETYILEVTSRRYSFANPTLVVNLQDNLSGTNFIGELIQDGAK